MDVPTSYTTKTPRRNAHCQWYLLRKASHARSGGNDTMDAVYRAADLAEAAATPGQSTPPRVVLDAKARRQRDKDSMRRARRKNYPSGLTSTTLDEWWSEVTEGKKHQKNTAATTTTGSPSPPSRPAGGRDGLAVDVDAMTGEQALGFFSRCRLPRGAPRRRRVTKRNPDREKGRGKGREGCPSVPSQEKRRGGKN